jgi:hypothetical protein
MNDKIENVAEMICHAHGEDISSLSPTEQQRIKTWAESIVVYLKS